jgi:hypothetical protein
MTQTHTTPALPTAAALIDWAASLPAATDFGPTRSQQSGPLYHYMSDTWPQWFFDVGPTFDPDDADDLWSIQGAHPTGNVRESLDFILPRDLAVLEVIWNGLAPSDEQGNYDDALDFTAGDFVAAAFLAGYPPAPYRAARFRIADGEDGEGTSFPGFTDGRTWNGWAWPHFSEAVALQVAAALSNPAYQHDAANGILTVFLDPDDGGNPEFADLFHRRTDYGVALYDFQQHGWCWEVVAN